MLVLQLQSRNGASGASAWRIKSPQLFQLCLWDTALLFLDSPRYTLIIVNLCGLIITLKKVMHALLYLYLDPHVMCITPLKHTTHTHTHTHTHTTQHTHTTHTCTPHNCTVIIPGIEWFLLACQSVVVAFEVYLTYILFVLLSDICPICTSIMVINYCLWPLAFLIWWKALSAVSRTTKKSQ